MKLSILGIPSSAGANMPGSEAAPFHLRNCGLNHHLVSRGTRVLDYGDCDKYSYQPDPENISARNLKGAVAASKTVLERTEPMFSRGEKVLLIGGDCTVTIGLVAAAIKTYPNLGMAYLDSSTDLNTPETTSEGILDSMGMAHILGFVDNNLSRIGSRFPLLDPKQVSAYGYHPDRLQIIEHDYLKAHPIHQYPGTEVTGNISETAEEARQRLENTCDAFIVHFDVDVIDFGEFPVADMPVYRGFGLKFEEALEALRIYASSKKCIAVSLTEFNPDRDKDGKLGKEYVEALAKALASSPKTEN